MASTAHVIAGEIIEKSLEKIERSRVGTRETPPLFVVYKRCGSLTTPQPTTLDEIVEPGIVYVCSPRAGWEEHETRRPGMGRIPGLTTPLVQNHVPDSQSSPLHGEGETELSERSWIQNKYAVGSRRVQGQGDAIRRPGITKYTGFLHDVTCHEACVPFARKLCRIGE